MQPLPNSRDYNLLNMGSRPLSKDHFLSLSGGHPASWFGTIEFDFEFDTEPGPEARLLLAPNKKARKDGSPTRLLKQNDMSTKLNLPVLKSKQPKPWEGLSVLNYQLSKKIEWLQHLFDAIAENEKMAHATEVGSFKEVKESMFFIKDSLEHVSKIMPDMSSKVLAMMDHPEGTGKTAVVFK